MKKLKIEQLKVTSFVTDVQETVNGGASDFISCNQVITCALHCSDTRNGHVCKQTTNYTAYFC